MTQGYEGEFEILIQQMQWVRTRIEANTRTVNAAHQDLVPINDVRLSQLSKLWSSLKSAHLSILFVLLHLSDPIWWEIMVNAGDIPPKDRLGHIDDYLLTSKFGFVQLMFASIESTFRVYIRHFEPENLGLAGGNFYNIYTVLFDRHLTRFPEDAVALLILLRLVRNTVHHNGIYFDSKGRNQEVVY